MAAKNPVLVALGAYLRSVREQKGWSQMQFALRCGVDRTYVGGVERGEYNVTVLTLRRMTSVLGITMRSAMGGAERLLTRGPGQPKRR